MLAGQTVLVVEAEYLIALDIQTSLEDLAAGEVIIAQSAPHAREMLGEDWHRYSLAIIEVERGLPDNMNFAGELGRRGVSVIVLTADAELHKTLSPGIPILQKPVPSEALTAAVAAVSALQNE